MCKRPRPKRPWRHYKKSCRDFTGSKLTPCWCPSASTFAPAQVPNVRRVRYWKCAGKSGSSSIGETAEEKNGSTHSAIEERAASFILAFHPRHIQHEIRTIRQGRRLKTRRRIAGQYAL